MRIHIALAGLAILGACAQPLAPSGTALNTPAALQQSFADPGRSAIEYTAAVFGAPRSVVGRPAAAAEAISDLEWLTVSIATDQRWAGLPGNVAQGLRAGRDEVRAALGVPAETTTNAAISALDATAASLRGGNRVGAANAVAAITGPGGAERAIGMLSSLPTFPRAAQGTAAAQSALSQMDVMSTGRRR